VGQWWDRKPTAEIRFHQPWIRSFRATRPLSLGSTTPNGPTDAVRRRPVAGIKRGCIRRRGVTWSRYRIPPARRRSPRKSVQGTAASPHNSRRGSSSRRRGGSQKRAYAGPTLGGEWTAANFRAAGDFGAVARAAASYWLHPWAAGDSQQSKADSRRKASHALPRRSRAVSAAVEHQQGEASRAPFGLWEGGRGAVQLSAARTRIRLGAMHRPSRAAQSIWRGIGRGL
jgi:hypothetical protein